MRKGEKKGGEKKNPDGSSEIRLIIRETGKDAGEAKETLSARSSEALPGEVLRTQGAEHCKEPHECRGGSELQHPRPRTIRSAAETPTAGLVERVTYRLPTAYHLTPSHEV